MTSQNGCVTTTTNAERGTSFTRLWDGLLSNSPARESTVPKDQPMVEPEREKNGCTESH